MAKFIAQMRRGTYQDWVNSGVIPRAGELVVEIDETNNLHKLKIGDGTTDYEHLAYLTTSDDDVTQILAQVLPRIVTITLDVDEWEEVSGTDSDLVYYRQAVDIEDTTEHSRLDLQPNADVLAELQQLELVFVTENVSGTIYVETIGDKPTKTYEIQATITETTDEADKIVGIPVGTPSPAHANKDVIDKLGESNGRLTYNNNIIYNKSEVDVLVDSAIAEIDGNGQTSTTAIDTPANLYAKILNGALFTYNGHPLNYTGINDTHNYIEAIYFRYDEGNTLMHLTVDEYKNIITYESTVCHFNSSFKLKLNGIEDGAQKNPTKVSAFTNDVGYQTASDVQDAINAALEAWEQSHS